MMEQIRQTSGLYYDDPELSVDEASRGPENWATPNQFGNNARFSTGDILLIPEQGSTFTGPNGNAVRVRSNPQDGTRRVNERSQRRSIRRGTDNACTEI